MIINLSPLRSDTTLTLSRVGDTLSINGDNLDMSAITEGATLPRDAVDCPWLVSDIERINGVLHLTLILPHGQDAPEETRFPSPITVTGNGPIALPPHTSGQTQ